MNRRTLSLAVVGVLLVGAGAAPLLRAQQAAPDLILTNGKIITVDDRFTIAQAVAIQATGSWRSAPIRRSAGSPGRARGGSISGDGPSPPD